jgi:ketosteroid isomerase-like protein
MESRTAEVVRQQGDGRWLYVIDHPTGARLGPPVSV